VTIYKSFNFENFNISVVIDDDNKIWFNGIHVYLSFGYKQPKNIVNNIDNDDYIFFYEMNINQIVYHKPKTIYINEIGLFCL